MRGTKFIGLLLLVLFITLTIARPASSAAESASTVVSPDLLTTKIGATSGAFTALGILDQSGIADTAANYVLFTTPNENYSGYRVFHLPGNILPGRVSSFLLQVNFSGPAYSEQVWSWSIYDWNTRMWNTLGDTIGTRTGEWNSLVFRVRVFSRYISPMREIRIQFKSNNASGDARLDYEALHLTYFPTVPTPTRSISTIPPRKQGYVFPITYTPSPTHTPTSTPSPTITPSATNTPVCATYNAGFEAQVLALLNNERTSRGIPALTSNSQLHSAARAHSQDMACNDFFSHIGSDGSGAGDRITASGYDFSTWGENIAAGYVTPTDVVEGWMDSSGHRENILNADFTEIGIGYVYNSASEYDHYWTTDFGAP